MRRWAWATLLALAGCGGEGGERAGPGVVELDLGAPSTDEGVRVDAGARGLAVTVERQASEGLDEVRLSITWSGEGTPQVQAAQAEVGPVEVQAPGVASCTLRPRQTGELPFTVRADGQTFERTALVLHAVAEGWGQPMAVPGLVNTAGYEDGVTITPDGQHLFVQYSPIYFSGVFVFGLPRSQGGCGGDRLQPDRCEHPWINEVIGPAGPPERPGFPPARIRDGRWRHNSVLYQVPDEGAPNFAFSNIFYGFSRQADGTFADPFPVAFDDGGDGLVSPFGLSFLPHGDGTATALFALNDPTDGPTVQVGGDLVESGFDVYTTSVTLGQPNTLGVFGPGDQPLAIERLDFPPQKLGFGDVGWDGVAGA